MEVAVEVRLMSKVHGFSILILISYVYVCVFTFFFLCWQGRVFRKWIPADAWRVAAKSFRWSWHWTFLSSLGSPEMRHAKLPLFLLLLSSSTRIPHNDCHSGVLAKEKREKSPSPSKTGLPPRPPTRRGHRPSDTGLSGLKFPHCTLHLQHELMRSKPLLCLFFSVVFHAFFRF